jgi:hypothetical protein
LRLMLGRVSVPWIRIVIVVRKHSLQASKPRCLPFIPTPLLMKIARDSSLNCNHRL